MIGAGDRVMVCVSGGKDSYTLLDILLSLKRSAPIHFDLIAVNLDQKQPDFPAHVLPAYLEDLGVEYRVIEQDTYSVVKRVIPEGRTMCGLCSRLRRGALYRFASENGVTKVALGHHRDDIVETLFLNLFFGGRLETIFSALRNVELEHLADTRKFDFAGLDARRTAQMTGAGVEPPVPGVALPLPKLCGLMSASEEAELEDRLESLAISA